jgi:hypothetical protein
LKSAIHIRSIIPLGVGDNFIVEEFGFDMTCDAFAFVDVENESEDERGRRKVFDERGVEGDWRFVKLLRGDRCLGLSLEGGGEAWGGEAF